MTVQDLIDKLKTFDPSLTVYGYNGSDDAPPISIYLNSDDNKVAVSVCH